MKLAQFSSAAVMVAFAVINPAYIAPAFAGFLSGRDFVRLCEPDALTSAECARYLEGILDGHEATLGKLQRELCLPRDLSIQQLAADAAAFIAEHPASTDRSAGTLILLSLLEAYPCQ